MHAEPVPAFAAIRTTLESLDAALYDGTVPFEATHKRTLAMTDATAHAVVARLGRLPELMALNLANAIKAANRHDVLAARELILATLEEAAAR